MSTSTIFSRQFQAIETTSPRLIADGSHFSCGGKPIKIFGMNLTFSSNFPSKSYSSALAARLSAAGINCVRLHHMDYFNYPNGIWDSSNPTTLSPQALDLLDYFIDQLAMDGVYVNMNLHVSRTHSTYLGLPDPGTDFDKIADIFTPQIIDAEKDYAHQLLTHVNPYRSVRYADDPAIAFVEITNEDSFFMWDGDQKLRALPSYYADLLKKQYNSWLISRYTTTSALSTAWSAGIDPIGSNILLNPTMQNTTASGAIQNWIMEIHSPANSIAEPYYRAPYNGARLQISQIDGTDWHLQFEQGYLTLQSGHYYTITFLAAADTTRTVNVAVTMFHDPWSNLGLWNNITLTTTWSIYSMGFYATANDTNARLSFSIGQSTATIYLANPEFYLGGQQGLLPGEYLESTSVNLFVNSESTPRTRDRLRFLALTEKNYFDSMRTYVKSTIGCDALVTGTIVFGPLGLYGQSDMDFIDSHSYWQHPQFPGTSWDPNNWFINQIAMTDNPSSATLFPLACNRLAGKPFTVTEYNHPAPNDYQEECVPMITSFAAGQDWDGVWLFDYGNPTTTPDPQAFGGFFDNFVNASKWGFVPAGAAILRDSSVSPLSTKSTIRLVSSNDPLGDLVELCRLQGNYLNNVLYYTYGVDWQDSMNMQLAVSISSTASLSPLVKSSAGASSFNWYTSSGRGFYAVQGHGAWVYTGYTTDFPVNTFGKISVSSPDFVAITLTPLKASVFGGAKYILLTASGRCENTGMVFSTDRTTVGTNWGTSPVLIQTVDATISLPSGEWTCQALAPDGTPQTNVPVNGTPGSMSVHIDPTYSTMWYLLTRTTDPTSVGNFEIFN